MRRRPNLEAKHLLKRQPSPANNPVQPPRERRGATCLFWLIILTIGLLSSSLVVVGAAYVGWTSGVATAGANEAATAEAAVQRQCELIPRNLEEGSFDLAVRRLRDLQLQTPAPACLHALLSLATALAPTATSGRPTYQPAPTALPTRSAPIAQPARSATIAPTARVADAGASIAYDLEALLAEARSEYSAGNFAAAIDTLDAIISIDEDYQSDLVRRLFLGALTSQAQALFRSGRLSEAIVLTGRAETLGDIESLQYERFIALLYLDAQRLKVTNPAEAVRLFNRIVYEQGLANYMNGDVIAEMQEALRNYGDAFGYQGEPCRARTQYEAALNLHPSYSRVSRGELNSKLQEAAQACPEQPQLATSSDVSPTGAARAPIGERSP